MTTATTVVRGNGQNETERKCRTVLLRFESRAGDLSDTGRLKLPRWVAARAKQLNRTG